MLQVPEQMYIFVHTLRTNHAHMPEIIYSFLNINTKTSNVLRNIVNDKEQMYIFVHTLPTTQAHIPELIYSFLYINTNTSNALRNIVNDKEHLYIFVHTSPTTHAHIPEIIYSFLYINTNTSNALRNIVNDTICRQSAAFPLQLHSICSSPSIVVMKLMTTMKDIAMIQMDYY
jgi:hypothetical protein